MATDKSDEDTGESGGHDFDEMVKAFASGLDAARKRSREDYEQALQAFLQKLSDDDVVALIQALPPETLREMVAGSPELQALLGDEQPSAAKPKKPKKRKS